MMTSKRLRIKPELELVEVDKLITAEGYLAFAKQPEELAIGCVALRLLDF